MDELGRGAEIVYRAAVKDATNEGTGGYATAPALEHTLAAEEHQLPSFFIIGPPRTGSSWLYEVLSPHTRLPSTSKETRFFDTHYHRGLKWYVAHFGKAVEDRRMGEVAPTYFACPSARERIAQAVPEAKIVCVFRSPVERIVSLYRLKRAYGLIPWSFEEAVQRDPELMETSKYAGTLKLWQRSFGANRVQVSIYDDLRENPQAFLDSIVEFIGVPRFRLANWQRGCVHDSERMTQPRNYLRTRNATRMADWLKARRLDQVVNAFKRSRLKQFVLGGGPPFPALSRELLGDLHERFRPEVEELEQLLGRDLSSWKPKAA
jgi:hypothetical protein